MSEKERKRQLDHGGERPQKKVALEALPDLVRVRYMPNDGEWTPILASAPGLSISSKISFKPYKIPRAKNGRNVSNILLHSSSHPRLDHIACEEESGAIERLQKHYIGIYDPTNRELNLVEVRKVAIRGSLRLNDINKLGSDKVDSSPNRSSARSALSLAFGTKKSQRAIRDITENAMVSPAKSQKSSQSSSSKPTLDPAASIVLDTVAASTASLPSREALQAAANNAKPIPKPNLQAESPADVYPLEQLVGLRTMAILPVREWMDKVAKEESIVTKSRFVSNRIKKVIKSEDVRKIKAMKYLLLLIEWYLHLKPPKHNIRKVPPKEQTAQEIPGADPDLLESITTRFSTDRHLNKWQTQYLLTHICALTLVIDAFNTDTHDLRADLRLEQKELSTLFRELGCRITPPSDSQRATLGLSKKEAPSHPVARLVLPLEFPKLRVEVGRRKGRVG